MPPIWPDQSYIELLGRVVYAISSVEWKALGDVRSVEDRTPGLELDQLAGATTSTIGQRFRAAAKHATDPSLIPWLKACGDALLELGPLRNDVLHARPATADDGRQLLYRWRTPHQAFWIDDSRLQLILDVADRHSRAIEPLRP